MMGAERRTMIMTDDEKKLTAYHEAGHALVSLSMPASTPIHKATIIPAAARWAWCRACPNATRFRRATSR